MVAKGMELIFKEEYSVFRSLMTNNSVISDDADRLAVLFGRYYSKFADPWPTMLEEALHEFAFKMENMKKIYQIINQGIASLTSISESQIERTIVIENTLPKMEKIIDCINNNKYFQIDSNDQLIEKRGQEEYIKFFTMIREVMLSFYLTNVSVNFNKEYKQINVAFEDIIGNIDFWISTNIANNGSLLDYAGIGELLLLRELSLEYIKLFEFLSKSDMNNEKFLSDFEFSSIDIEHEFSLRVYDHDVDIEDYVSFDYETY